MNLTTTIRNNRVSAIGLVLSLAGLLILFVCASSEQGATDLSQYLFELGIAKHVSLPPLMAFALLLVVALNIPPTVVAVMLVSRAFHASYVSPIGGVWIFLVSMAGLSCCWWSVVAWVVRRIRARANELDSAGR